MSNALDPVKFKEQERSGFNMVAERYERGIESAAPALERLLQLARLDTSGLFVLDLASGPAVVARRVAAIMNGTGHVLATDIAETALEVGKRKAAAENLTNIEFQFMDAEHLTLPDNSVDRVLVSFGLMHFPHPEKALAEINRVLKPGGRVTLAVWSEADKVATIQLALTVITRNFPPPKVERPSMFRFGGAGVLENLLGENGFREIETDRVTFGLTVNDSRDYWQYFLDVAGITTVALAKQPPEVLENLVADTEEDLEQYKQEYDYLLTSEVVLATAIK